MNSRFYTGWNGEHDGFRVHVINLNKDGLYVWLAGCQCSLCRNNGFYGLNVDH